MPISDAGSGAVPRGAELVVGIFVGGASRRMGSAKGLLLAPDDGRTLVERLVDVAREALPGAEVVLVGERAEYAPWGLTALADAEGGGGPLGGLVALLRHAEARGREAAVALACDLPWLSSALVARLAARSEAVIVAPRERGDSGKWQPLVARYSVSLLPECEAALRSERRSLQPLLDAHARVFEVTEDERGELVDWDTPDDVRASRSPI